MMRNSVISIFVVTLIMISGCRKDPQNIVPPQYKPTPLTLQYPDHFPELFIPGSNPSTVEGTKLGRYLYYDKKLSVGGPMQGKSCSSCHSQQSAFTLNAPGTAVLAHMNLGWNNFYLWNGYIGGTLEDIMKFEVEVFFQSDLSQIKSDANYVKMYEQAFGPGEITLEKTEKAMAQFFRSQICGNSKFDRYLAHEEMLTPSEQNGFMIFFTEKGDCFHCHTVPLMTDGLFHNIGLDSVFDASNSGRYEVTHATADYGKFKSPTLRNIALTAPYMHDGRFQTLAEVVEHYNSGVQHSNTLDAIMTKPGKEFGLQLTEQEKQDLVNFLLTLTDTSYTKNPLLSNPF